MVEIESLLSSHDPHKPLPPHARAGDAILEALPALAPPARATVAEVAQRRMIESGGHWVPWRGEVAPYMTEPMEQLTSRRFEAVVFAGPARCSKTEALILNPVAHAILAAPRLVHVGHMSRDAAREFSIQSLDRMIRHSPELAARKTGGKGTDNTFDKRFQGGARVTVGWPVVKQLSARTIPLVLFTDYDRQPADVEGEGSPFQLGRKRTASMGTRGMTVAESSPGFPVLDEAWRPATRHEAPPTGGILGLYNEGTRGRWYWACPDCGERFEPRLERLRWPDEGTPAERGKAARMACLHCGVLIGPEAKAALNAGGVWLHEGPDGAPGPLAAARRTAVASYWLMGAAAAFAPWEQIVARLIEAEAAHAARGDETALKTVYNVDFGLPYTPRSGAGTALSEEALRGRATDHAWQVAPAGTAFVTLAVDVQAGRFVVQAEAWGADLGRVLIDRFDIAAPPEGAPRAGERRIEPGRYQEDWESLAPLAAKSWPVAGAAHRLRAVGIVIDAGGAEGVSANAYAWWRRMRLAEPRRWHLVRGRGGERVKRAEVRVPETAHQGRAHVARDVRIIWAGADRLKDEIAAGLLRDAGGPNALALPRGAPSEIFAEYAAERREEKGWRKRPGVTRNEALDLSVYALALAIVLGAEKADPGSPPAWARPGADNLMAEGADGPESAAAMPEAAPARPEPKPPGRRRRKGRSRDLGGW